MTLSEMRSLHGNTVGNVIRLLHCHTQTFSCLGVKMQQKSKTGQLHPASKEISFVCRKLRLLGGVLLPPMLRFKRNPAFLKKKSPLTLMCFDGCSSSLSPTRFEKLQPQPIIYLLGRFHVSEMFSHKCTFCAPVSQLFMLQLCHSSMSLHPLLAKRKEWLGREKGREAERDRRDRPVE